MTLKCHAKFEEKPTHNLENDVRNLPISTKTLESVKTGTLIGSYSPMQKRHELKN